MFWTTGWNTNMGVYSPWPQWMKSTPVLVTLVLCLVPDKFLLKNKKMNIYVTLFTFKKLSLNDCFSDLTSYNLLFVSVLTYTISESNFYLSNKMKIVLEQGFMFPQHFTERLCDIVPINLYWRKIMYLALRQVSQEL